MTTRSVKRFLRRIQRLHSTTRTCSCCNMAVFFRSAESAVDFEVGEYQEFPKPEQEETPAADNTPAAKGTHLRLVLLTVALLCFIQAILNITLRLSLSLSTEEGGETAEGGCPPGWLRFASSCYYVSTQRRSWDASRRECMRRDADLVVIESRREQAFLTGLTAAAWVGMTDRHEEGTWIWVDGTPVNMHELLWARGQPDGAFGGEDCGDLRTMIAFIGLNDFNCSARSRWICEKTLLPG